MRSKREVQALSVYHSTHLDRGAQQAASVKRLRAALDAAGYQITRKD